MKQHKKKETRGGSGRGQGRIPKFKEETKTVSFRCPLSKEVELKVYVQVKLAEWSQGGI